jgi:hypothetical protein
MALTGTFVHAEFRENLASLPISALEGAMIDVACGTYQGM